MLFIQEGKIAGRGILIAGQPGTGKTAIAMGENLTKDKEFNIAKIYVYVYYGTLLIYLVVGHSMQMLT